jgi:hypothetical protein
MRALYISVVVMAVFVACQAQDDNRIYAIGSKGITPPKVISTGQPTAADPKKQEPAPEQKAGGGDQNSAPNNSDLESQETAPGAESGKPEPGRVESGRAESGRDEPGKDVSAKEKNGKAGKKKKPTHTAIAVISGYVGKDGRFHDAKVIRSAGKDLDPKALQKLSEWRFDPCKLNGVTVNCGMKIEVTFHLD